MSLFVVIHDTLGIRYALLRVLTSCRASAFLWILQRFGNTLYTLMELTHNTQERNSIRFTDINETIFLQNQLRINVRKKNAPISFIISYSRCFLCGKSSRNVTYAVFFCVLWTPNFFLLSVWRFLCIWISKTNIEIDKTQTSNRTHRRQKNVTNVTNTLGTRLFKLVSFRMCGKQAGALWKSFIREHFYFFTLNFFVRQIKKKERHLIKLMCD